MALDFPDNPSMNQTFTTAGSTWVWSGNAWNGAADTGTTITLPVSIPQGGTNATALPVRDLLGVGIIRSMLGSNGSNVDTTSRIGSTAAGAAINGTLTVSGATTIQSLTVTTTSALGNATAATPPTADNSATVATTAFVKAQGYSTGAITLTGDTTGSGTGTIATIVAALQGRAVANTAPTDGQALVWSQASTRWQPGTVAGGGGAAAVTMSDTPPASPAVGQGWWNSADATGGGQLYLWFNDGTSSQWVPSANLTGFVSSLQSGAGITLNPSPINGGSGTIAMASSYPGNWGITGTFTAQGATLNANTTALPAASGGALLRVAGADANPAQLQLITFGYQYGPSLNYFQGRGTGAATTATLSGDYILALNGYGYGATGYGALPAVQIYGIATQNFTDAARGSQLIFATTPSGTVNLTARMTLQNGLLIGSPAGGDLGPGTINAAGAIQTAGILTVAATSSNYAILALRKPASGVANQLLGYTGANLRWELDLGNSTAEGGSNTGSDLIVARFDDTGTFVDTPLLISRATGSASFNGQLVSSTHTVNGVVNSGGYAARAGLQGAAKTNYFNIDWTGTAQLWIDNTLQGTFQWACDYRIKENVAALPSTWNKVKSLRPISYTRADNPELLSVADPVERWGFLAHELQETLTESAATGVKDAPNEVQSPDPLALLAALTKALQEAQARIEALEAKP
jgi:hypothetical protein